MSADAPRGRDKLGQRVDEHSGPLPDGRARERAEQRLAAELAAMNRLQALNERLFRASDVSAVLSETVDAARTLLNTELGSTHLYDAQTNTLQLVAQNGLGQEFVDYFQTVTRQHGSACALAFNSGKRVIIEDVLTDPRCEPEYAIASAAGFRGVQATPLIGRDGKLIAMISNYFLEPRRPSDQELRILDLYVRQATHLIERFWAEEALRDSEQRFAALFEQAACGIARVDLNGRVTMVNDRYCEILGRPREELVTLRILDLTHAEDVPRNMELLRAAVETGQPYSMEKRYLRADGSIVWATVDVSAIRDAHGTPVAVMGICQDITARKYGEEALREADRRKDEFLATLAHELRNPLAPICNGLELLRIAGRDVALFEGVHATMTRQTQQMVRLVDDLLDVSRITRGKIELRKHRVEVASIIGSAVETAGPVIDGWGHQLTVSLPDYPLVIEADPSRLAQVISNLLNNAAKYMQSGGTIEVDVEREGNDAVISVRDSGIGIPPEMLDRIFDLFTQVDRSMERSHAGLGIGLTIVKRLVEMHGGTVEARSAGIDQGSEFIVRFPLDPRQESDPQPASHAGRKTASRRRVLVVDDNESAVSTLTLLLQTLGHEVRAASDGVEGMRLAETFRPHVVLLDLAMPKQNGYETARRIRAQPWGRDMTLVALTGWGQQEYRRRTKEAGFDHHFVKPIDMRQLENLLAQQDSAPKRDGM